MPFDETPGNYGLIVDRGYPTGNSPSTLDNRFALHTKIRNDASEAIPVFVTDGPVVPQVQKILFNQVLAVAAGGVATILTYTVPASQTLYINDMTFGGQNIATYQIMVDAVVLMVRRTWFSGGLSVSQSFGVPQGLAIQSGSVLTISVNNFRPTSSDFEASAFGVLFG